MRSRLSSDDSATPNSFDSYESRWNAFGVDEASSSHYDFPLEQPDSGHNNPEFAGCFTDDTHASINEDSVLQTSWGDLMAGFEVNACMWQTNDFLLPERHTNTVEATMASSTTDQPYRVSSSDTSSDSTIAGIRSLPRMTHSGSAAVTPFLTPHVHQSDHMLLSMTVPDLERSICSQGSSYVTFGGSLDGTAPGDLMYGPPSLGDYTYVSIETPSTSASTSGSPSS